MDRAEQIEIRGLEVRAHVGVPDEERAEVQVLKLDIRFSVRTAFRDMEDDISRTIDYAEVAQAVEQLAASRERRLIETMATDVASLLQQRFGALKAWVRVRKKILPNARWVAVETTVG